MMDKLERPEFARNDERDKRWTKDDRLPGADGSLGAGLKFDDAVNLARNWYNRHRFTIATILAKDDVEFGGVPSGIMRQLEFDQLTRDEGLAVIETWYVNVAVPTLLKTEQAPDKWVLDELAHLGGHTEQQEQVSNG